MLPRNDIFFYVILSVSENSHRTIALIAVIARHEVPRQSVGVKCGASVLVLAEDGVSTKECYEKFDSVGAATDAAATAKAVAAAESGDLPALFKCVGNDLAIPAATLNAEVGKNLAALKDLSPSACTVTGSGSAVFALYETPELCRWACDKLKKGGYNAIIVYTVPRYSMR